MYRQRSSDSAAATELGREIKQNCIGSVRPTVQQAIVSRWLCRLNITRQMIEDFRLKVFKSVAEMLSFTRAAKELNITQPAVTKHINELERQLSTQLFRRQGSRISLTRQGEALLEYANRILDIYTNLNNEFCSDDREMSGTLKIGASTTIAQYVLPPILASFHHRYPNIAIKLTDGNTYQIERLLTEEKIDFGIIEGIPTNRDLHYSPFRNDEVVLVTSARNDRIGSNEIKVAELRDLDFVVRESGSGTLEVIEEALKARGIALWSLHIDMQLGSTESIKHYLYNSNDLAFVSICAVSEELKHGLLKVIYIEDLQINRTFSFASVHGKQNRLVCLFEEFIK